jgi:UDP-N-acetylmuramoyl-tripeptide--D-alanyl-D-alanine ligase
LWDTVCAGKRGGDAESAASLEPQAVSAIRAGDMIMIEGSLGSRMKTIVNALEKRFPGKSARDEAAG